MVLAAAVAWAEAAAVAGPLQCSRASSPQVVHSGDARAALVFLFVFL